MCVFTPNGPWGSTRGDLPRFRREGFNPRSPRGERVLAGRYAATEIERVQTKRA